MAPAAAAEELCLRAVVVLPLDVYYGRIKKRTKTSKDEMSKSQVDEVNAGIQDLKHRATTSAGAGRSTVPLPP
ncbi:hypothetical protein DL95DRAFT_471576 [Leptodontidium sp. 2 PMI_412]|nr:hypothetical protein DL95DRAFT_471576 [Leptodontidium sp. 2 PMI_412]